MPTDDSQPDPDRPAPHDTRMTHDTLESQRAQYLSVLSQAPVAIGLMSGPAHVVQLANPLLCKLWGREPEQVLNKPILEAVPDLKPQGIDRLLDGVYRSGVPYSANEVPICFGRVDGSTETLYCNLVYAPIRDDEGRIEGTATIILDVTSQVVARNLLAGQARQSAFIAGIGTALTSGEPLAVQLDRCCRAMVILGAAFARIWLHNEEDNVLELHASAGMYTNLNGAHSRVQVGQFKIGRIAAERRPHLTNSVVHDPLVADRAWASREGLIAFAGYPLILGERLIGVMALFAREELSDGTLQALGAVADQIALAVEGNRVERFRELFIGMLGHDLRNPLNAVLTGAQLLARHPDVPDRPREIASRIRRSAGRMSRMIEQLLDYTRVRSATGIPIITGLVDMFAICRDTLEELQAAHPDRVIELSVSGSGAGEWDADRMSQVFSNLIGNALAYGDPAEPIRIALEGDGDRLACDVHNVGPAIPALAQPHIFHPFRERGDNSRGSGGLGLGLFITREILKAHGGEITVHSSDLSGTTFRWSIPKAPLP
ncbi:MAG: PAS domain-containing sensor histidine kinase [Acidobacteriota bacterium]|nr:PAS domain-containing sensor histidine kinase [Acidobacteriota bacterium]